MLAITAHDIARLKALPRHEIGTRRPDLDRVVEPGDDTEGADDTDSEQEDPDDPASVLDARRNEPRTGSAGPS